jgi:hypothetical protein
VSVITLRDKHLLDGTDDHKVPCIVIPSRRHDLYLCDITGIYRIHLLSYHRSAAYYSHIQKVVGGGAIYKLEERAR